MSGPKYVIPGRENYYWIEQAEIDGGIAKAVIAIAADKEHSLALLADSTVRSWGDNTWGQLGDGTNIVRSYPVIVANLTGVIAISTGDRHSIALKSDGTVWTWGNNSNGQLGTGGGNSNVPVKVDSLEDIIWIASGSRHNLVMKNDSTLWAWGKNTLGQLGDSSSTQRDYPVRVYAPDSVKDISVGNDYTLLHRSNGEIYAWGLNGAGQFGDGTTGNSNHPRKVNWNFVPWKIGAGKDHSLVIASDSVLWAWGRNFNGQIGDSTFSGGSASPKKINSIDKVVDLGIGYDQSFGIKYNGEIFAWGDNDWGQLGIGTVQDINVPDKINLLCHCPVQPVVDFISADSANKVVFSNLSINSDFSYWNFGDGSSDSITTNPTHVYDSSGVYHVCLTAGLYCDTITICDSINVVCPLQIPLFSYQQVELILSINDSSTNANSWHWDFGDGNTSNLQNPQHTFANEGEYTVCETAFYDCGESTVCDTITASLSSSNHAYFETTIVKSFPNPSNGIIHFRSKSELEDSRIVIYSSFGSVVYSGGFKNALNLTGLTGIYFFRISNHNLLSNGKFVLVEYK
ncbi:MAG: PKD domain-containing protein, partial [Bacteroidetes bacterium]|nr:PKD domain-containing protein [Bacteroidota bacterium]